MESNSAIRIAIVEDHRLFREGLRLILAGEKDIKIVGEAQNGLQAIEMIDELQPEVILLDLNMPVMDGFQVLKRLKQKQCATKALLLTASREDAKIIKSLNLGAKGYLTKNASSSDLIKAIKAVSDGQLWIERKLITLLFNEPNVGGEAVGAEQQEINETLTQREHEVLGLLTKGMSNNKIAKRLYISEKTVKSHLNSIFKKLNVNRRLEAILYAIKLGLV